MLQQLAGQRLSSAMSGQGNDAWIAQARSDAATLPESERAAFARFFTSLDALLATQPRRRRRAVAAVRGSRSRSRCAKSRRERRGPRNAFAITFPQGMLWAIVGCIMTFASSLVLERMQGTLVRLRASPLTAAAIMLGKSLACFAAIVATCTLLVLLARVAFGVQAAALRCSCSRSSRAAFAFTGRHDADREPRHDRAIACPAPAGRS